MQFQRRLGDIETIMGLNPGRGGIAPDDVERDLMDVVISWHRPIGTVVLIPLQDDYIDVSLYATPNSDISVSDNIGSIGIQRMPDGGWTATESKRRNLRPGTPAYMISADMPTADKTSMGKGSAGGCLLTLAGSGVAMLIMAILCL